MRILYVGDLREGYPIRQRMVALQSLGHTVLGVDTYVKKNPYEFRHFLLRSKYWLFRKGIAELSLDDINSCNQSIRGLCTEYQWDVIWLDKALSVTSSTIEYIKSKQKQSFILGFSHDDMSARHNQSRQFLEHLPQYDLFVSTKSYNVPELINLGCKKCIFIGNGYDPSTHFPLSRISSVNGSLGTVGFIGAWENERDESITQLSKAGIRINIWGGGWQNSKCKSSNLNIYAHDILGHHYTITLATLGIALCFLRKKNRDLQTTRSVEIPACGVFMLAERTDEHRELFKEGVEADFFSSQEELIDKTKFYLKHPGIRTRIAAAGYRRCQNSGYSNNNRLEYVLSKISKLRNTYGD